MIKTTKIIRHSAVGVRVRIRAWVGSPVPLSDQEVLSARKRKQAAAPQIRAAKFLGELHADSATHYIPNPNFSGLPRSSAEDCRQNDNQIINSAKKNVTFSSFFCLLSVNNPID